MNRHTLGFCPHGRKVTDNRISTDSHPYWSIHMGALCHYKHNLHLYTGMLKTVFPSTWNQPIVLGVGNRLFGGVSKLFFLSLLFLP